MRRLLFAICAISQAACASLVTGKLADAMAGSGSGLGSDEDPELVRDAAPFGLKTMESVLVSEPEHRGLLTALAGGFTQYGVAFVNMPADQIAADDLGRASELRQRAKRLFLRARTYALRGLDVAHEGFSTALRADAPGALARAEAEDVPLLYWTAASWGLAIAADKNDTTMLADFPIVDAIAARCLALDPAYKDGALHELALSLEMARPGGSVEAAKKHYEAALALSKGRRAGTYVGFAETVSVKTQDLAEFKRMLDLAEKVDVEASPDDRLANTLFQRRARWLRTRIEDLFVAGDEAPIEEGSTP